MKSPPFSSLVEGQFFVTTNLLLCQVLLRFPHRSICGVWCELPLCTEQDARYRLFDEHRWKEEARFDLGTTTGEPLSFLDDPMWRKRAAYLRLASEQEIARLAATHPLSRYGVACVPPPISSLRQGERFHTKTLRTAVFLERSSCGTLFYCRFGEEVQPWGSFDGDFALRADGSPVSEIDLVGRNDDDLGLLTYLCPVLREEGRVK